MRAGSAPVRLLMVALALGACALLPAQAGVPAFAEVHAAHRPSDVTVLDRHGVPVQTLRTDLRVRRLAWVPLEAMSPVLLQAVVLSEDRRFWEHSGVDWGAAARSAFANLWNTRTRGASTLTMQLAGLVDEDLARPAGGRSVGQKLGQVVVARELESSWRKHEILEAYLNLVPLRGEIVGIDALAQTLFGKHPRGLDAHEAAITAALVRAPQADVETVGRRACGVLELMKRDCTGVRGLAAQALARRGGMPLGEQIAPHFARQVVGPDAPSQVRTALDAGVQRVAVRLLRAQLAELSGRHVEDGAVVVLDNASGEVRAWVGSVGAGSAAAEVDGVLARRQPGSTIKPFVYGLAFERRLLTPASLLDDSPAQVPTGSGVYRPQNYDRSFKGWVSARTALGSSLNVPALRASLMLPPDALHERLNALGMALPQTGGWYGHALALGSGDVTLLALTNAYRTLARGGLHSAPVLVAGGGAAAVAGASSGSGSGGGSGLGSEAGSGSSSRSSMSAGTGPDTVGPRRSNGRGNAGGPTSRVLDPAAAYLVGDILADPSARALTFGLDSALATRGFAAVKTGTSKDMRDNWCIGYTDRYTVGVWVGNASGAPMRAVSGVSGAAPVWQALVRHLHAAQPSRAPVPPPGVQRVRLDRVGEREPGREELFMAGTAPTPGRPGAGAIVAPATARPVGISSPADGSVYALDPDLPPQAQRIRFEGEPGTWVLGGRRLGQGATLRWTPQPGRHELKLLDARGRMLQAVRFEVRAAGPHPNHP
jgi:penicillin-binding protein 1C